MIFPEPKQQANVFNIFTPEGKPTENVTSCKYIVY